MYAELLTLRIIHIVGAMIWGGSSFFVSIFLLPALGTVGPAAGPVLGALVKRKTFTVVPTVAVLTMLAGLRMLWINSAGFSLTYFSGKSGLAYLLGAACAVIAFTLFMTVNHPTITRLLKMGPQIAAAPEAERGALMAQMNALRARAANAGMLTVLLLTVSAISMAVGRYL